MDSARGRPFIASDAIETVTAWEALDSRGTPTVACAVTLLNGGHGQVTVPSGASTGGHESHELRDGDPDHYEGRGVQQAVANVRDVLTPAVTGLAAGDWRGVDAALCSTDGTLELSRLGANAMLAVSLATVLAGADGERLPLYRYLASGTAELPMPMVNVISGGAHADGGIDIQDVLVVPVGADSFPQALEWSRAVRERTAEIAIEGGMPAGLVADEGGLGLPLRRNVDALELVCAGIERAGLDLGVQVTLAIDVAANGLADDDGYRLVTEDRHLSAEQWIEELCTWASHYPLTSIEDPLAEDDWASWTGITARLGADVQILGDDLFVTNRDRLQRGIDLGAGNAILLKPNQAGTLSRTEDAWHLAAQAGFGTVLSARSGDTEDAWLADVAVAWSTGQIKVGSTTRSERTAKWNRLLQIAAELGDSVPLAHPRPGSAV